MRRSRSLSTKPGGGSAGCGLILTRCRQRLGEKGRHQLCSMILTGKEIDNSLGPEVLEKVVLRELLERKGIVTRQEMYDVIQ